MTYVSYESTLSFPVDGLTVTFPVQFVVQVNTQVSVAFHHLHLFPQDGNGVQLSLGPLKIHNHLLCLSHLTEGVIPILSHKAVHQFPVDGDHFQTL